MTTAELVALSPFLALAATSVLVVAAIAVGRSHAAAALITLFGLAAAASALAYAAERGFVRYGDLLSFDGWAVWFVGLLLLAAFVVTLLSFSYFERRNEREPEELYALLVVATLGACVLVLAEHLVMTFLGIETLTVALYPLIAYRREERPALEAALKYVLIAGAASATMLFGMALVYADIGAMSFRAIALLSVWREDGSGMLVPGLALLIVGVAFKLALVPFHAWTPDVYQGSTAPIAGFIATVSKAAVLALAARLFVPMVLAGNDAVLLVLALLAAASMIGGNLLALRQSSLKRLLAYSSIAHVGYALVALVAAGPRAVVAVGYYLAVYVVTTLAAFGVLVALSGKDRDADALEDVAGLAWRRPFLALVLVASMLSLAGIPLTGGFVAKIFVAAAGVDSAVWPLVLVLVVGSALGIYYYLRVAATVFAEAPPLTAAPGLSYRLGASTTTTLALLTAAVVWLGVHPWSIEQLLISALSRG